MAIVIHTIGNNRYAYEHFRVGPTVKTKYIGPVDTRGNIRAPDFGKGVGRVPVGTTHARLKAIYAKAARKAEKKPEQKRIVTAKRVKMPEKEVKDSKYIMRFTEDNVKYDNTLVYKVDEPFESEAEAKKFLDNIKPLQVERQYIKHYYMKDGKKISGFAEVMPITSHRETIDRIKKEEKEAEDKKKEAEYRRKIEEAKERGEDVYTIKDLEKMGKEYGIKLGKADDPPKQFTKKEMDSFEDQLRDEGFSDSEIDELLALGFFSVMMNMMVDTYDVPWESPFPPE